MKEASRTYLRFTRRAALAAGFVFAGPQSAAAEAGVRTELVMVEQFACEWCEQWDEEIGPIYPLSWEGKAAPLRRIDISDERPEDLAGLRGLKFTPTFVLMVNGEEAGRIAGYSGEDFFWGLLDDLLAEAGITEPVTHSPAWRTP